MAFLMRAAEVFRDFVTGGVPSSGNWKPKKSDVRAWGEWIESIIGAFFSTGGKIYQTLALLNADLTPAVNSIVWVMEDPTAANNGIYRKVGGTGVGSWVRAGDLPFSFIVASNPGAGTPNAIQATTSIPVSSSALVILPVAATNTASPVTVSFTGGSALTVKTNSGNNVAVGGLVAGMMLLGMVSGSTFRLVSDQISAAVVAAAEAAQAAAQLARDQAVTAASSVQSEQTSRAAASANYHPTVAPDFIRTAGYLVGGDGGKALYKKVASEPATADKMSIALSGGSTVWYKNSELMICPEMFGAKGDDPGNGTGTDDRAAVQAAINASRRVYLLPNKTYRINGKLTIPRFQQFIGMGGRSATEYWVETGQTGATRLIFTGSEQACFENQNPAEMFSHGCMKGFIFRDTGGYDYAMNFKQMLDFRIEDVGFQTDSLTMSGLRSRKINPSDSSWVNWLVNFYVRLPDTGNGRTVDVDWSDSTVLASHLTGGIGANDAGYGVRWINNQFERSKYVGLTITKTGGITVKNTVVVGNSFDANKTHGMLLDATGDTSGNYKFATIITGNNLRTEDPVTGVAGSGSIAFINPSANTYKVGPIANNVELTSGVPGYAQSGPWTIPASGVMNINS